MDEGPHHAVFVKPAGMTVVAGRGVPRPTLLDVAQERSPAARPVHRLDRVTSGVCVVAKTPFGQQALSEAFRRHLVDKRYLALVEGSPPWDKLDIDARLSRIDDPGARKGPLAHQTVDEQGVRALTRVRVLARAAGEAGGALLECRPETGRMHQIRCHLAHVGHPIAGDVAYGATTRWPDAAGIGLLALCLSFPLPQGGRAFVTAPVPQAFSRALAERGIDAAPIAALVEKFKRSDTRAAPRAGPGKAAGAVKKTRGAQKPAAPRPESRRSRHRGRPR